MAGTDMVASCSMDRTVKLWDVNALGLKITLLGHSKVREDYVARTLEG